MQITEYTIIGLNSEHFYYLAEQGFWRYAGSGSANSAVQGCQGPGTALLKFSCLPILERTETIWLLQGPQITSYNSPTQSKKEESQSFSYGNAKKIFSEAVSRLPFILD